MSVIITDFFSKEIIFSGSVSGDILIETLIPKETYPNYKLAYKGETIQKETLVSDLIKSSTETITILLVKIKSKDVSDSQKHPSMQSLSLSSSNNILDITIGHSITIRRGFILVIL